MNGNSQSPTLEGVFPTLKPTPPKNTDYVRDFLDCRLVTVVVRVFDSSFRKELFLTHRGVGPMVSRERLDGGPRERYRLVKTYKGRGSRH